MDRPRTVAIRARLSEIRDSSTVHNSEYAKSNVRALESVSNCGEQNINRLLARLLEVHDWSLILHPWLPVYVTE